MRTSSSQAVNQQPDVASQETLALDNLDREVVKLETYGLMLSH
jgi:hypothetical protein